MLVRIVLTALALLSFAGVAHAGDKVLYQPAPGWVLAVPPPDPAKASSDAIFQTFDRQQRVQPGGKVEIYSALALRMTTPQVLTQFGTIQLPWAPAKGDLIVHAVEIVRDGKPIDLLAAGQRFTVIQREQRLEMAWFDGLLTATLAVEGLRVGDVLRVVFTTTVSDPVLGGHFQLAAPLFTTNMIQMNYGRNRVIWPLDMKLQSRSYLSNAPVEVTQRDGYNELSMVLPLAKPADMPGDAPMRFQVLPMFEATSFQGWGEVVTVMAPLYATADTIAPGSPLAAEVKKIAGATTDPRLRAALALQLVQDKVRYLFRGMDDGNYVPQTPAQTWELRYGDCKAKTLLLLAILHQLGIEADAALVSMSTRDLAVRRLPMPGAFDHVIVRARIGEEVLWLDGTAGGARLEDLNDVPPFRYALPLRAGVTDLVEMPLRGNARPDADVTIEVDYRAGIRFPAPVRIVARLRGTAADMVRTMMTQAGEEMRDTMIDAALAIYAGDVTIVDRKAEFDESTGVLTINATGLMTSGWKADGERTKLTVDSWIANLSFSPDRARAAWRDIPVVTDSDNRRTRMVIQLPDSGRGFTLDGNQTLPPAMAGIALSRTVTLSGGTLTIEDRVVSGIAEIAPADLPAARQQVALAKTRALKLVAPADMPSPAAQIEAARKAKAFDPILAVFDAAIKAKPDQADSYVLRGAFLLTIHDRRAALRDFDMAIKLAPSPDLHVARAAIRQEVGDDKGAEEDFRGALDLDPGSVRATSGLATLLARQGKLDEALAMLDAGIEAGGDARLSFVMQRASLLGEAGRVDEGLALLDAEVARRPGSPMLLNSRCWYKGTNNIELESALKDCTKSIELADNPSAALDSRALIYFRLGRNDEALADLDAALKVSPDQAASLFLRGVIYSKMGDKRAADDLAAARFMSPRIDEEYARYGLKP